MYKAKLKTKYKDLVRLGKDDEAQEVLNQLRSFSLGKEVIIKKEPKFLVKKENVLTKEELKKMSFFKLKKLAKKFGETGRSQKGLIKDILKHM